MQLNTASQAITLAKQLESDSARFYEELAKASPANAETFRLFARENLKNIDQTQRCYYGVITDAIEGCYCFDLDSSAYEIKTGAGGDPAGMLKPAIEIEENIVKFYNDAAAQSKSLLADVPRLFAIIAKKRSTRIAKLKAML